MSERAPSHRWWNDPRVRALGLQLALVAGVVALGWYLLGNTLHNLESRGITTGFGFLDDRAGFGIIQSLVEYSEASSFGRTFVVGLLNTLLVSMLGIVLATLFGFVIGVARPVTQLADFPPGGHLYRDLPQYPAVAADLLLVFRGAARTPETKRQSGRWRGSVSESPRVVSAGAATGPGFEIVLWAAVLALFAAGLLASWARRRQLRTGRLFPAWPIAFLLIIGLPAAAFFVTGTPLAWDLPELRGFNFRGGITVIPELIALLLALSSTPRPLSPKSSEPGSSRCHGQTEAA